MGAENVQESLTTARTVQYWHAIGGRFNLRGALGYNRSWVRATVCFFPTIRKMVCSLGQVIHPRSLCLGWAMLTELVHQPKDGFCFTSPR